MFSELQLKLGYDLLVLHSIKQAFEDMNIPEEWIANQEVYLDLLDMYVHSTVIISYGLKKLTIQKQEELLNVKQIILEEVPEANSDDPWRI
jgi:hypothetical protein